MTSYVVLFRITTAKTTYWVTLDLNFRSSTQFLCLSKEYLVYFQLLVNVAHAVAPAMLHHDAVQQLLHLAC